MTPASNETANGPGARTATPPAAPGPVGRGARPWLAVLVVLALVAAGALAWQDALRRSDTLRLEVAQRLGAADAALEQARTKDSDLANELRDAQAKIALLEARIAESQSQQAALETLYRDLAPSRDELALNEVEQILVLASQQLALAGNVQAALGAVQLADAKLARVERPQWAPLRRSLARDIVGLKAVPYVDIAGIAAKLDQAQASIDGLQLARDERLPAPPRDTAPPVETGWRAVLRDAWAELRALVRIEVSDRPAAALIAPSQAYFLRENLRLRMLSARLALLSHDDLSLKADLAAANGWLRQYFDLRTKPVEALSSTLTQIAATSMGTEMPDLARTLDLVRTQKIARDGTSERAPPPAAPARAK